MRYGRIKEYLTRTFCLFVCVFLFFNIIFFVLYLTNRSTSSRIVILIYASDGFIFVLMLAEMYAERSEFPP